jgi:predicted nuclease with RNAse H fold
MQVSRIISVDLPWSDGKEKRTVAATLDADQASIATDLPSSSDDLARHLIRVAAPNALVLLDIPIEGCDRLTTADAFRPLDRRFLKAIVPILPSVKSGDRGARLRNMLRAQRSDLRVEESYPYAVLRVLWSLKLQCELGALDDGRTQNVTLEPEWRAWPPRYKRAREVRSRREAMTEVAGLLKTVLRGRFADLVRSPSEAGGRELDRICDEYDALLGLIAGWAFDQASPWSWRAEVAGEPGAIVTIADEWLRSHF